MSDSTVNVVLRSCLNQRSSFVPKSCLTQQQMFVPKSCLTQQSRLVINLSSGLYSSDVQVAVHIETFK